MTSDKTLILMDTNKTRDTLSGSPRYDTFEFGREFTELKTFLETNNLTDLVTIAITEMTLSELLSQKKRVYDEDMRNLNSSISRLRNLDNVNIPNLTLPGEGFDLIQYLGPKVETFLQENNIHLIRIEQEKKAPIFDVLVKKVIEITPPFKGDKNKGCGGHGFKDAVIWETFKQSAIKEDFSNIILFTGDSDFNGCEKEVEDIFFKITKSQIDIIEELKSIYASNILENKYKEISQNEYLIANIKEMMAIEMNTQPEMINITSLTNEIIDTPNLLIDQFSDLVEDEEYFKEMVCFISKVKVGDKEYMVKSLIDLTSNEIETVEAEELL